MGIHCTAPETADAPYLLEQPLSFLWLELTSRCNLRCVHCYAESGPTLGLQDVLTVNHYESLLDQAAGLGCRRVQFIGGEPTLYPALPRLIAHARSRDYEFIEVFTNATHISDALLDCFTNHGVAIANSFYSDNPAIHDAITKRRGSHASTLRNLKRLLAAGLTVRAGIVSTDVFHAGAPSLSDGDPVGRLSPLREALFALAQAPISGWTICFRGGGRCGVAPLSYRL